MTNKRKPLSAVATPPEASEETIDAILKEVGGASAPASDKEKAGEGSARTEQPRKAAPKAEVSAAKPSAQKERGRPVTVNVPLAPLGQQIDRALFDEMRVFVAKQKIVERGYSIRTFLEEAIAEKLSKKPLDNI